MDLRPWSTAAPVAVPPLYLHPARSRRGHSRGAAHRCRPTHSRRRADTSLDAQAPGCASSSAGSTAARRSALRRLQLSWKKAKKLLGRADPVRRQAFVEQLPSVLADAQRDRHLLVYLDEAHIHQDADLGYGWAERGRRLWVASSLPGLAAKLSFYGLYLYNEGQVRLWPQRRAHDRGAPPAARRAPHARADRAVGRRLLPSGRRGTGSSGHVAHRADAAAGLQS
jgi:hypothetical protein